MAEAALRSVTALPHQRQAAQWQPLAPYTAANQRSPRVASLRAPRGENYSGLSAGFSLPTLGSSSIFGTAGPSPWAGADSAGADSLLSGAAGVDSAGADSAGADSAGVDSPVAGSVVAGALGSGVDGVLSCLLQPRTKATLNTQTSESRVFIFHPFAVRERVTGARINRYPRLGKKLAGTAFMPGWQTASRQRHRRQEDCSLRAPPS